MFELVPFRRNRSELAKRRDLFDSFFNDMFSDDFPTLLSDKNSFKVDIKESDKAYTIAADLPGVKKEDIKMDYENKYLTISAKREEVSEEKKENYFRRERSYGEFKRSFYVDNIEEDKIEAAFTDGVLNVTLPKAEGKVETKKKIDIR